jgi:hypothetical protein
MTADPASLATFTRSTLPAIEPVDWADLFSPDHDDGAEWLVEPLIPVGRQVALFSEAKVGKSLVALEMSAAMATGRPVLGRPAGPPVTVVYIDEEMTRDDLRERLTDLGYSGDDDLHRLVYFQLVDLPPLDTEKGGRVMAEVVAQYLPVLVVLDTMARVVGGAEDSSDTYRDFYRCTGKLLKDQRVALLRLDHSGKDSSRGQRGSSAKADDVDVVFAMTLADEKVRLKRTHSRVPWVPPEVVLERRSEPTLHHVLTSDGFCREAIEVARQLDGLNVPIDATSTVAMAALKADGNGRRKALVLDALKLRRQRQ